MRERVAEDLGQPRIAYRETIIRAATGKGEQVKQSGGSGPRTRCRTAAKFRFCGITSARTARSRAADARWSANGDRLQAAVNDY